MFFCRQNRNYTDKICVVQGVGGNSKLRLFSVITMKKTYKPVDSFLSLKYSQKIVLEEDIQNQFI